MHIQHVPGFAGTYTVFGQVINGFDTLDKILWSASDKSTKMCIRDSNCVCGNAGEEIVLDEEIRLGAKRCIDEMLRLGD